MKLSKKISTFIVFIFIALITPNSYGQSCLHLSLKHDGGINGQDIQGNPYTRFHVKDSSGEDGCPPKNSIVELRASFYDDIEGTLKGPWVSSLSYEPLQNTIFLVKGPFREEQEVKVIFIIPCSGKGNVGSGTPDLCCEGLQPRFIFNKDCELLSGGYVCVNCGDGVCEKDLEDHCNCPEDCFK